MDIIAVPLDDPAAISLIHREPLAGPIDPLVRTGCHDAAVILGDVNLAACASADTINVRDISDPRDPDLTVTIDEPGVGSSTSNGRWHSAGFTWDGAVIVAGWEPGGGGAGECEVTEPDIDKSMFFYDARTGAMGLTDRYVRWFQADESDLDLESDDVRLHVHARARPQRWARPRPIRSSSRPTDAPRGRGQRGGLIR